MVDAIESNRTISAEAERLRPTERQWGWAISNGEGAAQFQQRGRAYRVGGIGRSDASTRWSNRGGCANVTRSEGDREMRVQSRGGRGRSFREDGQLAVPAAGAVPGGAVSGRFTAIGIMVLAARVGCF